MEQTVREHGEKLAKIETILEVVSKNQSEISNDMKTMVLSINKMEVIVEKFANLEANTNKYMQRIHRRIDDNENAIKTKADKEDLNTVNKSLEELVKLLRPFIFIAQYPKIAIFIASVMYSMTISDIRHKVIGSFDNNVEIHK